MCAEGGADLKNCLAIGKAAELPQAIDTYRGVDTDEETGTNRGTRVKLGSGAALPLPRPPGQQHSLFIALGTHCLDCTHSLVDTDGCAGMRMHASARAD